jgi:hypothetical protein
MAMDQQSIATELFFKATRKRARHALEEENINEDVGKVNIWTGMTLKEEYATNID